MLEYGETYLMRKDELLFNIKWSGSMIQIMQRCIVKFPSQADEWRKLVLEFKEFNTNTVQELLELKRWRIKNNIKEDEIWRKM